MATACPMIHPDFALSLWLDYLRSLERLWEFNIEYKPYPERQEYLKEERLERGIR